MTTYTDIQASGNIRAGIGTVLTVVGAAILGSAGQSADVALGAVLIGLGQFLVLSGLITWSVSRGTQPMADDLTSLRNVVLDMAKRSALPEQRLPAMTAPGLSDSPPPPTAPLDWASDADRQECRSPLCSARGLRTSAYRCPACGTATSRVA